MTRVFDVRRRMARLLASDVIQKRIARLNVDPGEFCADILEAVAQSDDVAALEENEVFCVCELAAQLGVCFAPGRGDAALVARRGRACMQMGFAGLRRAVDRAKRNGKQ